MLPLFISMFGLGLVTSLHCVSMCGPLVLTYAVKGEEDGPWHRKLVPNLAYQAAKIMSYVLVGFVLGAIGSALNLNALRPYVMVAAGVFMIIIGLGMTGLAPWAARFTPRPPKFLMTALLKLRKKANADAAEGDSTLATPIMFGLITGLMPCAPLQAAQLSAAATGSAVTGAFAMLAFGLGTAPLMLGFGTASSMLPKNLKQKMMVVLAVVVMLFGVVYLNRAATLLGWPVNAKTAQVALLGGPAPTGSVEYVTAADGVVEIPITIVNTTFQPDVVRIPADKPVRFVVDRQEANACSDQIAVPQLGVLADLAPNAVTKVDVPAAPGGSYTLTCGMGMMSGQVLSGTAAVASSQPSPVAWALLLGAVVGGGYWVKRQRAAVAPVSRRTVSERATASETEGGPDAGGAATAGLFGLNPAEIILLVLAIATAVVAGLVAGGGLGR